MRLLKPLAALCVVAALTVPLSGCAVGLVAGYLIARDEKPKTVTTTCTQPVDGSPQTCTTVTP